MAVKAGCLPARGYRQLQQLLRDEASPDGHGTVMSDEPAAGKHVQGRTGEQVRPCAPPEIAHHDAASRHPVQLGEESDRLVTFHVVEDLGGECDVHAAIRKRQHQPVAVLQMHLGILGACPIGQPADDRVRLQGVDLDGQSPVTTPTDNGPGNVRVPRAHVQQTKGRPAVAAEPVQMAQDRAGSAEAAIDSG